MHTVIWNLHSKDVPLAARLYLSSHFSLMCLPVVAPYDIYSVDVELNVNAFVFSPPFAQKRELQINLKTKQSTGDGPM